jgi:large subunit ribosomal protein L21
VVSVELLEGDPGQRIELSEVLLVGGEGDLQVGTPTVEGARVVAEIEGESKGPKIRIFKFKRRKRYRLRQGHRQHYTRIRIESIEV